MANLPNFLDFKSAKDLVRIGKKNDGGYLVSNADILKSDLLIGLGINNDWSFEEDFHKTQKLDILAYDGSVFPKNWIKSSIKLLLRLRFSQALMLMRLYVNFKKFFGLENVKFYSEYVGYDDVSGDKHRFKSLDKILSQQKYKNIFLKIDIEGSEYRILNSILKYQNQISGMVIELHDCDLHLQKIEEFVNKFELKLVHIHANNFASSNKDNMVPIVLELTFSKYGDLSDSTHLPHILDMPNNIERAEVDLTICK